MAVRILCSGDIHLGRIPSRIAPLLGPGELLESGELQPQAEEYTLNVVLGRIVRAAIEERVDAVVFTGDLVDSENAFFEGHRILREALVELDRAGLPVFAVAGNHDFDVLPKLADTIGRFHLLSRDGRWEIAALQLDGAPVLQFIGRSFTAASCTTDLLDGFPPLSPDLPVIGVAHCDVDVSRSRYAPVRRSDLLRSGASAWLLGHKHAPEVVSSDPLILYPGSPQGLDPGEPGPHGPFLITVHDGGRCEARHLPLAPLQYHPLEVPLDGLRDINQVAPRYITTLTTWRDDMRDALSHAGAVALRVCFSGEFPALNELRELAAGLSAEPPIDIDGIRFFVESARSTCLPMLDLAAAAQSDDPPGLLARRLCILLERAPAAEYSRLIDQAKRRLEAASADRYLVKLQPLRNTEEEVRERLLRTGRILLSELIAQRAPA